MGFTQKSNSNEMIPRQTYPEFPNIPDGVGKRVPEIAEYLAKVKDSHKDLIDILTRERSDYSKANLIQALNTLDTNTTAALAALTARIVELESATSDSGDTTNEVETGLEAHIAATSGVHGVTGNVVGTTDIQELEDKTIGRTNPALGRFTNVLQYSGVRPGDTLDVPESYQGLYVGECLFDGVANIDGRMVFL